MTRGRALRLAFGSMLFVFVGLGCSIIVSGDLPEFACTGTAPSACPTGSVCDTRVGRCVSAASVEDGGPDVGDDENSDGEAGPTGPLALGAQCRVNDDCTTGLCGTSTLLTPTVTNTTGPICTSTCCKSSDCPANFVCFGAGTGGNYCVPAALAQRTPPASGGKGPGVACGGSGECRSGICDKGRCLDTCCAPSDCAPGTVCRLKSVSAPGPSHDIWVCAASEVGATHDAGDDCAGNGECKTDACIGFMPSSCRPSCCTAASCAAQGFSGGHCVYGQSGAADYFKFCFFTTNTAKSPLGAACTIDANCQSDFCDPELMKCASICCTDFDCPQGQACRPSAVGTPLLRCVAR